METVLFSKALLVAGPASGAVMPVILGIAAASAVLGVVYVLINQFGVRLPLKPFFGVTSAFLYYMAFVFMGKGIAELHHNELTRILENIREETSLRLFRELMPGLGKIDSDVAAITALLGAAVNYLVIRSRTIRIFNTVDIRSDDGWKRLENAIVAICERSLAPRRPRKR